MPLSFPSALIRFKRLERSWSQEGLCDGICAVSYLSKIEQGKADPNPDILRALMERLGVVWHGGAEADEARRAADDLKEAFFAADTQAQQRLFAQLDSRRDAWLNGPHMLDLLLLEKLCRDESNPSGVPLSAFEDCFDSEQRALWLLSQNRCEEALTLMPTARVCQECGGMYCQQGAYPQAIERLLRACTLAAEEGRARVLMHARALLGNCYSNQGDEPSMHRHYTAALRLATELGDDAMAQSLRYNMASTDLQLGHPEKALAYFASLDAPTALDLHKLAVCLEKLGRPQEALRALDRAAQTAKADPYGADDLPPAWPARLCALVRYRLEHPGYLKEAAYGQMLNETWQAMQRELPHGFVLFHRPWMEEWYVSNRQYKQAYELRREC